MNQDKIKLIWDFKGEDALEIAKHHCIHLKEFTVNESLDYTEIDSTKIDANYSLAYIVVSKKDMIIFRDKLKPHRGQIFK
ncbi:MAG: hypothetical protein HRT66_03195 [Flavobacteriaceae bacterium]|nr:hypothetical protein [Flavobacteriaceae bacterium]